MIYDKISEITVEKKFYAIIQDRLIGPMRA